MRASLQSRRDKCPDSSGADFGCDEGDPHVLVDMLLDATVDRLDRARSSLLNGERAALHHYLSSALSMILHLRDGIDVGSGSFAKSVFGIFGFMLRRLPSARRGDDPAPIDEVLGLLRSLRSAWAVLGSGNVRH